MFQNTREELAKIKRNITELSLYVDVAEGELNNSEEKILQSASPNNKQSKFTSQIAAEIQDLHDTYWTTSHDKTKALLGRWARQLRTLS